MKVNPIIDPVVSQFTLCLVTTNQTTLSLVTKRETTLSLGKNSHTCDSYLAAQAIHNNCTLCLVDYPVLNQQTSFTRLSPGTCVSVSYTWVAFAVLPLLDFVNAKITGKVWG